MKKLKNIHPLKEVIVHCECITLGVLLGLSRIGEPRPESRGIPLFPIAFTSAEIPLPHPQILRQSKYRRRKNFSKKYGKEV